MWVENKQQDKSWKPKWLFSFLKKLSEKNKQRWNEIGERNRAKRQELKEQKNTFRQKVKKDTREQLSTVSRDHAKKRSLEIVKKRWVVEAQTILKKLWYLKGSIDGDYGPDTHQAVIAFQKSQKKLANDGIIGNQTLKYLRKSQDNNGESDISIVRKRKKRKSRAETVSAKFSLDGGVEALKWRWRQVFKEFYAKLKSSEQKEVLAGKRPLCLVDPKTNKMLYVDGKKKTTLSVILWQNGTTTGKYVPRDKKTPIGMVHRFNYVKLWEQFPDKLIRKWEPRIDDLLPADNGTWRDLTYNKRLKAYEWDKLIVKRNKGGKIISKRWERRRVTVTWFSLQSSLAGKYGGRYFHWVGPNRNKTWGCVGIEHKDYAKAIEMAKIISRKKGFWYTAIW